MQAQHGPAAYGFMPPTFLIPEECAQLEQACAAAREPPEAAAAARRARADGGGGGGGAPGGGGMPTFAHWIVKPAAASCGAGVTLHDANEPLPDRVRTEAGVASAYIHPPYLVDGAKFDLRLYVLVTRWEPLTAYLHASGIVRFAAEPYTIADLGCRRAHLCNYAVNKRSERFVRSTGDASEAGGQAGSIWSLDGFKRRLAEDLGDARSAEVWCQVDDIVVKTLRAAREGMLDHRDDDEAREGGSASSRQCFQLYGFDLMLDAEARPWLLEVNGDPGLRTESAIFGEINVPMVADLLHLVGVRVPAASGGSASEPHHGAQLEAAAMVVAERRRYERQAGWRCLVGSA